MVADLALRDPGSRPAEQGTSQGLLHWDVLGRLEKGPIGKRRPGRLGRRRRSEPAGCFLYGPYLHLPQGRYRLTFRCRCGGRRCSAHPVLGVEIIVLSRFQQQWRDFTGLELAERSGHARFRGPARAQPRKRQRGTLRVPLFPSRQCRPRDQCGRSRKAAGGGAGPGSRSRWRLLGRLHKSWLGRRDADGGVAVSALRARRDACFTADGRICGCRAGSYRLIVQRAVRTARRQDRPVLGIEVSRRKPLAQPKLADAAGPPARDERGANWRGAMSAPTSFGSDRSRSILRCRPIWRSKPGRTRRSTSGCIISASGVAGDRLGRSDQAGRPLADTASRGGDRRQPQQSHPLPGAASSSSSAIANRKRCARALPASSR